jgi:immune inhibitor A
MQTDDFEARPERNERQSRGRGPLWLALGCSFLLVCMACVAAVTATGVVVISRWGRNTGELLAAAGDGLTPSVPALATHIASPTMSPTASNQPPQSGPDTPSGPVATAVPTATSTPESIVPPEIQQDTLPDSAIQDLLALLAADYPPRDYYEAASRLGHTEVGKRTVASQTYQIGDRENFSTDDGLREAVLLAVTEHAYFWVESTLDYDQQLMQEAAYRFESEYFPPLAKLYGTDWQVGVDDDPRFSALHLDGYAEGTELGFFNSGDQYPRSVNSGSNEQEIVYLNMENLKVGEPLYYGTLVHELQHLIQWQSDPNEPIWLSEGLAQFTELYVGLDTVDTSIDYLNEPETRLNTWPSDAGDDEMFAHYGAAYLFVVYFWERFGDQAIQALMQQPADGLAGFNAVLKTQDPLLSLDQFVLDWATANYLDDPAYGPDYSYEHLTLADPDASDVTGVTPYETLDDLEQFGVSYIDLDLTGQHTVAFAGDSLATLIPAAPYSGEAMWYVPALDELDAQLTAPFDLTNLDQANLTFWTWYDLEDDYDFAYVSASDDGGATWDVLMPTHAQAGEYGPALTGRSVKVDKTNGGWIQETVSLSAYTGSPVLIRFEVLSDSAIAKTGFAIDDIAVPELAYLDDVELEGGVWQAHGFVRTGYQVPQIWRLNLILPGPAPRVEALDLDSGSRGQWTIDFGDQGGTLVVTAQTPFVSDSASYWLAVDRQN